ncbi:ABC transporter transmembrane domain-containing protein [Sphingomonas sp. ID0503]|uniref:ABC transporter transmembrane domain-containing protein n=1 Tax=Sphingomonas sp. ID0503 TaxID=3399691 RepID=UPI003AFA9FFD
MAKPKSLDAPPESRRSVRSLTLIWGIAGRYPAQIAAAGLALLLASAGTLAIPYGFKRVIDLGFAHGADLAGVSRAFRYLLMIVVVLAAATAMRFYFVSWLGERVVADLRKAVQRHLLTLAPRFFEENRPSEVASRLTADTTVIEQTVGTTVSVALRNLVVGTGGIIYLFILSPKLAALLLIGIPVAMGPIMIFGRRVRALSRASQDRIADVGGIVSETLGAMRIVQAFGQEEREAGRFGTVVDATFATAKRRIAMRAVMTAVVIGVVFGAVTLVLWEGTVDVAAGRMSGGSIAAFVLTGGLVAGAFGALSETYGDLLRASGAAQRLGELLAAQSDIVAPASPAVLPQPSQGALTFEGVSFHYPTRPDLPALHGIDLAVRPGEMLAVVGPSGAGKSTLFQLVERFYDPDAGRVTLDGVDLREADPADIRARIAMVPQETVIFAASARDNLRYGRWTATDDEIWAAAEAANAATFLRDLPDGLDTFLGEAGTRLSGGQRQRIAIARAILRDAPLLLLDEATSALDAESERLVQRALDRLMQGRTTMVIAHRLATVRAADRIVVMDQGRIVEEGTHTQLVGRGGLYARLAALQFEDAA